MIEALQGVKDVLFPTNTVHKTTSESEVLPKEITYLDTKKIRVSRGDIFLVDLGQGMDSEQGGIRPCLIIQNDVGNRYSGTTIVAPISSQLKDMPTHYNFDDDYEELGFDEPSQILFEQIRTISKRRIKYIQKLGHIDCDRIIKPLFISLGLESFLPMLGFAM